MNYFKTLENSGMSLMIYNDDKLIFESDSKGIRPHFEAINKIGDMLHGSVMVDKIVGRAAALLILYSKPKKVYAMILSTQGKNVFEGRINFDYLKEIENIKTKNGKKLCPFEQIVQGIDDPFEAYKVIIEKASSLKSSI
jgi:hypothetical protein